MAHYNTILSQITSLILRPVFVQLNLLERRALVDRIRLPDKQHFVFPQLLLWNQL